MLINNTNWYFRVKHLFKKKFLDWRRNEAAIIIQRNLAAKNRDNTSLANITMASLRSFRKLVNLVFLNITDKIFDEILEGRLSTHIHLLQHVINPAVEDAMETVVSDELEICMEWQVKEWIEEQLRLLEIANRRLAIERARLEEEMNMMREEEYSRQHVSQSPVLTKELLEKMEIDAAALQTAKLAIDTVINRIVAVEEERQKELALLNKGKEEAAPVIPPEVKQKQEFENLVHNFVHDVTKNTIRTVSEILASQSAVIDIDPVEPTLPAANEHDELVKDEADQGLEDLSFCMDEISNMHDENATNKLDEMSFDAAHASILESSAYGIPDDTTNGGDESSSVMEESEGDDVSLSEASSSVNPLAAASSAALSIKDTAQLYSEGKYHLAIESLNPSILGIEKKLARLKEMPELTPEEWTLQASKLSVVYSILGLLKARNLFALGAYEESRFLFEVITKIREETLGATHYLVGEIYFFRGEWYRSQAMYDESEKYLMKADRIFQQDINSSKAAANAPNNSTIILSGVNKLKENSIGSYTNSGEDDSKSMGSASNASNTLPSITVFKLYHRTLIAYSELLRQRGQYYKAYEILKKVQASLLFFKQFNLVSFEVKEEFLMSLIAMFIFRGKYNNAISLHQELLDKRRVHYGLRHPKVATSMSILGKLMLLKANYGEAANYIEESISIRYQFYANYGRGFDPETQTTITAQKCNHPAIAASHLLKAEGFVALGRYAEALIEANRALSLFTGVFRERATSGHPSIANCLYTIGCIYNHMGEPIFAKNALEDALIINKTVFSVEIHTKILDSLTQLALSLINRGIYTLANEILEYVVERRDMIMRIHGNEHAAPYDLHLSDILHGLSMAFINQVSTARDVLKSSIQSLHKIVGQQHPLVSRALTAFSEVCKIRGSYADARILGGMAYDIYTALHGEEHEFICTILRESADNIRIPGYYGESFNIINMSYGIAQRLFVGVNSPGNKLLEQNESAGVRENVNIGKILYVRAMVLRDSTPLYHTNNFRKNVYTYSAAGEFYQPDNFIEAERNLMHALNIFREKCGENSGMYAMALLQLSELYRLERNYEQAERFITTAVAATTADSNTVSANDSIASVYNFINAYTQSTRPQLNVQSVISPQSVLTLDILLCYASFLIDVRQYERAHTLMYNEMIPLTIELLGDGNATIYYLRALCELCQLFSNWDSEHTFTGSIQDTIANPSVYSNGSSRGDISSIMGDMLTEMKEVVQKLPAVQGFIVFWTTAGFSMDHVWVQRLQQIHFTFIDNCLFHSAHSVFTESIFTNGLFTRSLASQSQVTGTNSTNSHSFPPFGSPNGFSSNSSGGSGSLSGGLYQGSLSISETDPHYAPKLSMIEEGSYASTSFEDSLSRLSKSMTGSEERNTYDSQSYASQSIASQSNSIEADDRSVSSEYGSRSYISYISQYSNQSRSLQGGVYRQGSDLREGSVNSASYRSISSKADSVTPRDSPRSYVSGRSHMSNSLTPSKLSGGKNVEDATIESWASGYYSRENSYNNHYEHDRHRPHEDYDEASEISYDSYQKDLQELEEQDRD